jgi:hypothetical protein
VVIGLSLVGVVDGWCNSTYDTQGSPMPFPGEKSGLDQITLRAEELGAETVRQLLGKAIE